MPTFTPWQGAYRTIARISNTRVAHRRLKFPNAGNMCLQTGTYTSEHKRVFQAGTFPTGNQSGLGSKACMLPAAERSYYAGGGSPESALFYSQLFRRSKRRPNSGVLQSNRFLKATAILAGITVVSSDLTVLKPDFKPFHCLRFPGRNPQVDGKTSAAPMPLLAYMTYPPPDRRHP